MMADVATDQSLTTLLERTWHRFLSPHYDDVSISCGGTAALLAANDLAPEVAIIFAGGESTAPVTAFAAEQHLRWGLDEEGVNRGRQREESAAATMLGTVIRLLPFPDAIYRGDRYLNDDQLFGETAPDEDDLAGRISESLGLSDAPDPEIRIYAPLGLGNHVDHQHVFNAGLAAAQRGWNVWFYEDLPYGLQLPSHDARFRDLEQQGVNMGVAALIDVSAAWRQKLDAIMCYASQLDVIFRHDVNETSRDEINRVMQSYARAASLDGRIVERYWRLR